MVFQFTVDPCQFLLTELNTMNVICDFLSCRLELNCQRAPAVSRACDFLRSTLGLTRPGFMLSPASQAEILPPSQLDYTPTSAQVGGDSSTKLKAPSSKLKVQTLDIGRWTLPYVECHSSV